jgi:hypothetical protein
VIIVNKKVKIGILIAFIIVAGCIIGLTSSNILMGYAFDQINYNYTGYVSIPNNTQNGGSLGGTYNINGKGQKFKFNVNMRGAENFEDPLDYNITGLNGNGTIDTVNVNSNTIKSLLSHDFKSAMFQTPIAGHFDMRCAAWNGYSNFTNNGSDFIGEFKINGQMTDFQGNYRFVQDGNRIAVITSYNYNFVGQTNTSQVNRTYYM